MLEHEDFLQTLRIEMSYTKVQGIRSWDLVYKKKASLVMAPQNIISRTQTERGSGSEVSGNRYEGESVNVILLL